VQKQQWLALEVAADLALVARNSSMIGSFQFFVSAIVRSDLGGLRHRESFPP